MLQPSDKKGLQQDCEGNDPASPPLGGVAGMETESEWDAGDMGCGELVFELRLQLKALRPGQILKLTARDPGAPEDLPAWCRLTGHRLTYVDHPVYLIRRRED